MESTMLKIYRSGKFVYVQTYSRKNGRSWRFIIDGEKLDEWCCNGWNNTFRDYDCGNYMSAFVKGDDITIWFDWLCEHSDGTLSGRRQRVKIPVEDFFAAAECERAVRLLSDGREKNGRVIFTERAQKMISRMDSKTRRALSKAMRRGCLQYPDTTTTVYADGGSDFFFRTNDGMCGGLIRHEGSRNSVTFGVHT